MRNRLAYAVSVPLLFTVAVAAQSVDPIFVRDAVGLQSTGAAPRLADREGIEPLLSLAASAQAVPEEIDSIHEWNASGRTPMKNGFTRSIGAPLRIRVAPGEASAAKGSITGLVTMSDSGTTIWSGSVRIEGAYRMRVHLKNVSVPSGTRFWVYGRGGQSTSFGSELIDAKREVYTPSVAGDIAYLEMELPKGSGGGTFDIANVLELVGPQGNPEPNDAPTCLIDGTCVTSSTLSSIDLYRAAQAHLEYVKDGGGYVCTGGLLNDVDTTTFIPWMLTANHCFSTQTEATTLEAFFDYKTASCSGTFPSINSMPKANGSTLLATAAENDFTFIRLNSAPAGRGYLGWTTSAPAAGTKLYRLSHPFPDAYSQPAPQAYSSTLVNTTSGTCTNRPRGPYIYSTVSEGGIYGGSSGSPVVIANGQVVGQLYGQCGPSPTDGCNAANYAVDGAFATTFSSISQYVYAQPTAGCTANSTTACMLSNRFKVTVKYRAGFDNSAADTNASVKSVSGFANPNFETAFFYFNSDSNIEMIVKILDQGNRNAQGQATIDVLTGSATPLRAEVTIVDTLKGVTKTYTSNFNAQDGKTDFSAFVK